MIDDIAEDAAKGLFRVIGRFLFSILIELLIFYTGEVVLFTITLGYKKPRWDYYTSEKPSKFVIFTEMSLWVGFAFWLLIFWFVNSQLLN